MRALRWSLPVRTYSKFQDTLASVYARTERVLYSSMTLIPTHLLNFTNTTRRGACIKYVIRLEICFEAPLWRWKVVFLGKRCLYLNDHINIHISAKRRLSLLPQRALAQKLCTRPQMIFSVFWDATFSITAKLKCGLMFLFICVVYGSYRLGYINSFVYLAIYMKCYQELSLYW